MIGCIFQRQRNRSGAFRSSFRSFSLLAVAVMLCSLNPASLWAQTSAENLQEQPTTLQPKTLAEADRFLEQASSLRESAEREYTTEKEACYSKILVNSCLVDAKDKHREAIIAARKFEGPAQEFKREMRRSNLDEKEKKQATDAIDRPAREKINSENYREKESAKAAERQQKITNKNKQAAEGRQKAAREKAERQQKTEERERKEAERATAKKSGK